MKLELYTFPYNNNFSKHINLDTVEGKNLYQTTVEGHNIKYFVDMTNLKLAFFRSSLIKCVIDLK